MGQRSGEKKDWKEFEKLVARIEAALSPQGALVRSPDHVQDLVEGNLREVDASIRFNVGTVPLLITVECRRRTHTQDITWIEQLARKKDNIGAAKTIAVSWRGFTHPAIRAAQRSGIEVRTVNEIPEKEIAAWMSIRAYNMHFYDIEFRNVQIILSREEAPDEPAIPEEIMTALKTTIEARIYLTQNGSVIRLLDIVLPQAPKLFPNFRTNVPAIECTRNMTFPAGRYRIQTVNGPVSVLDIQFTAMVGVREEERPVEEMRAFSYNDPAVGRLVEASESVFEVNGRRFRISMHRQMSADHFRVSFSQAE